MAERFRDLSQPMDVGSLDASAVAFYGAGSKEADALEHLATIDLLELCIEAKIERCRATRDLSSCGRCVQHVLKSCGHASLCEECSKRCDVCPICRTSIPNNGCQLHLRLYYKCIEAGLISRQHDDRSQEREASREHALDEIQRLYLLFDVALENNLVSLICHYVTDVCMNENAVSSDPVFAFLLDEVVVKNWCKWKFGNILSNLRDIYSCGVEMESSLIQMQKFSLHLGGLSSVLEVMALSFKERFAAQLNDLHILLENVLKTKEHLEVMVWCARHQFLRDVQSRFCNSGNSTSWNLEVTQRKLAATERSWAEYSSTLVDSCRFYDSTLFIEDALSNLGIEESYVSKGEEVDISCLQDENLPLLFLSKIDVTSGNACCYPFQSLRAAADVLFLRGTSDMVVAKQAIFIYYLFDRHWTMPDAEWKYMVDDFAVTFGIPTHSVLESLVFYLLDNHTPRALQEAICHLPEIAGPETHPKIAQVLIERECPDVALSVLRCSGREGWCINTNPEKDCLQDVLLGEAVIAVRVRIECGLLTEAFMLQRAHILKAKEKNLKNELNTKFSNSSSRDFRVYLTEVLVTEICHHCIRRNLVDRMIELPWNSEEEKYLHKYLLDYASQNPLSSCGSLLVVYYLQRHRFLEAFQVNCLLENFEQNVLESVDEDAAPRRRMIIQWRERMIDNSLGLLPEVQRQKILSGDVTDQDNFSTAEVQMSLVSDSPDEQHNPAAPLNSSIHTSVLLQTNLRKVSASVAVPMRNNSPEAASKAPPVLQRRLLSSFESPSANVKAGTTERVLSYYSHNLENPLSNGTNKKDMALQSDHRQAFQPVNSQQSMKFHRTPKAKPMRAPNSYAARLIQNEYQFPGERSIDAGPVDFAGQAENMRIFRPRVTLADNSPIGFLNNLIPSPGKYNQPDGSIRMSKEAYANTWSFGKKDASEPKNSTVGARWRSDESSEDEQDFDYAAPSPASRRRPNFSGR